jgi:2-polyprenyl-3-methyl-5-hydroxy-6-metoxy-1,4-benzoquinol methylase
MNPLSALLRRRRAATRNRRFVTESYQRLIGEKPDGATTTFYLTMLQEGGGRNDVLLSMVRSEKYVERVAGPIAGEPYADDEAFLAAVYRHVLHRDPDQEGVRFYGRQLVEDSDRRHVAEALVASDEHVNRVTSELFDLPSLRQRWPDRYVEAKTKNGQSLTALRVPSADWFDRLEAAILENDYYEKPGIWEYSMSRDKRLMAEIVGALKPLTVLEIGCSNGTVLQGLHELGIDVTGLDISPSAVSRADPSIRDRILIGDLLSTELSRGYDVVFGLDVFEHLNPNRLADYVRRVTSLTNPGGFVFTNLPAFGDDPVFGTVFEMDLEEWDQDVANGRHFSLLPVDDHGYPWHGHLVWAHSSWWVAQFESAGLKREPGLEQSLHECYDDYMRVSSPARRSFYVFSHQAEASSVARLADQMKMRGSKILSEEWKPSTPGGAGV